MEYTHLLVWLGLIFLESSDGAGLLQGDAVEQAYGPTTPTPAKGPNPQIDGVLRGYLGPPPDDLYEPRYVPKPIYQRKGNIRKSFSLETTTPPASTPHFEALRNRTGREDQQDLVDRFNTLRRGYTRNDESPSYNPLSYEEQLAQRTTEGHIQRVPLRHYTPGPNVIKEEDLDGSLGSFSYATPTPSSRPLSYRGNVRYTIPTASTDGSEYEPTRGGKNLPSQFYGQDNRRAYIAPTTYRPIFSPTPSPRSEYSFSFKTHNHSREEHGNSKGHFRGSIRYKDTLGREKEISYDASPDRGLVTSESPLVAVAGRSGHRVISPATTPSPYPPMTSPYPFPTTPYPYQPSEGGFSYSYASDPIPSSTSSYENDLRYGKSFPTNPGYPNPYSPVMQTERSLPTPDGSYVFSYNAGDHERKEVRDSAGNVRGMYSYLSPEGERKMVQYEANAAQGFVAQGSHLPVQEARREEDEAGGTYFFSYDAGDHGRQEARDGLGNVQGSFTFLTGDGLRKTVHYQASPQDGFQVSGTHLERTPHYK